MSSSTNQIRLAQPTDAQEISMLYSQLMNHSVHVTSDRISQIGNDPKTALFVSIHQNKICATALVALCGDVMFDTQPFAVIENIVVLESLRGQGFGTRLFQHIEEFCIQKRCYKITITSSAQRSRAHHFFEYLQFDGNSKHSFVKYLNY